jgi:hypothetical protein
MRDLLQRPKTEEKQPSQAQIKSEKESRAPEEKTGQKIGLAVCDQ